MASPPLINTEDTDQKRKVEVCLSISCDFGNSGDFGNRFCDRAFPRESAVKVFGVIVFLGIVLSA
jgi:hypothetical protein